MDYDTHLNSLQQSGLSKSAIISHDGSILKEIGGFNSQTEENLKLIQGFNDASRTRETGIILMGISFITILANERSIYGRKGHNGICAVKTKTAVVIGYYSEPVQGTVSASAVERVADQLIHSGY
eukprot:TRINITY_DN3621_c0_g1_i1.p1 TRINITY_DN3621_c0_g1~~TRINITY_DN3621_c0_g1_i1.p1  ORF type:complete len:125 (-),score=38.88 TRINITY_DN3621_c0_g1_i1:256-630(-)